MNLKRNLKKIDSMWAIIKFDKKNFEFLKKNFKKKLGEDIKIYAPKISFQKYKKNRMIVKEFNLLGDYLFCFHDKFKNPQIINSLKFTRGIKYFLNGFINSQEEINKFIKKCKDSEDQNGHLTQDFFELYTNSNYEFTSGPFTEKIFRIIDLQKNKINILLGNIKIKINRKDFLFRPA